MADFAAMTEEEYWDYLAREEDIRAEVIAEQPDGPVDLNAVSEEVRRRMAQ